MCVNLAESLSSTNYILKLTTGKVIDDVIGIRFHMEKKYPFRCVTADIAFVNNKRMSGLNPNYAVMMSLTCVLCVRERVCAGLALQASVCVSH